jgi:hypothetical protein
MEEDKIELLAKAMLDDIFVKRNKILRRNAPLNGETLITVIFNNEGYRTAMACRDINSAIGHCGIRNTIFDCTYFISPAQSSLFRVVER